MDTTDKQEPTEENTSSEEELPKLRVEVPTKVEKVKKFTSASNANMHLQIRKAKRAGLVALHKIVSFMTPKSKQ
jgi:hypothetical protein